MSYAGMYDPTPRPEPRRKPEIKVVLACGHEGWATPWWMSDPLYGGWKRPDSAVCRTCEKTVSILRETDHPEHRYPKGRS